MNPNARSILAYMLVELKINQNQFASLLGISAPTLSKLLLGHYSPSYKKMTDWYLKIAGAMKKKKKFMPPIDDLFPELKLINTELWKFYRGRFVV